MDVISKSPQSTEVTGPEKRGSAVEARPVGAENPIIADEQVKRDPLRERPDLVGYGLKEHFSSLAHALRTFYEA
jgi:hypothetical protein